MTGVVVVINSRRHLGDQIADLGVFVKGTAYLVAPQIHAAALA